MSKIEWTDATWNPVIGCRHVAEGCRHCYAETMSKRLAAMGQKDYASILTPEGRFNGRAITRPDTLAEPLRWRKPRLVFVNSMSDLFHEDVPCEFIAAVFGVMAACPQHTFQVLTKRPARALAFFEWAGAGNGARVAEAMLALDDKLRVEGPQGDWNLFAGAQNLMMGNRKSTWPLWPLKNVWLGVSVATQPDADALIPILLKCDAAVRFVSAEPLIEWVKLRDEWMPCARCRGRGWYLERFADNHATACETCADKARASGVALVRGQMAVSGPRLDWVIVGGESGPGARACDVESVRSIVKQCQAAAMPVFVKQLGANSQEQFGGSGALRPRLKTANRKGGDPSEWPEDLRVREFPQREGARA